MRAARRATGWRAWQRPLAALDTQGDVAPALGARRRADASAWSLTKRKAEHKKVNRTMVVIAALTVVNRHEAT
jgi:hypothetical protein